MLLVLRFMRNHALNALVRCHSNQKQHICHSWNRAKWAVSERKTHGDKGWRKNTRTLLQQDYESWTLNGIINNNEKQGQRRSEDYNLGIFQDLRSQWETKARMGRKHHQTSVHSKFKVWWRAWAPGNATRSLSTLQEKKRRLRDHDPEPRRWRKQSVD